MRELGGMRRLVDDDVFSRCRKQDRRGLAKRFFSGDYLAELTSRMRSEEIPQILDRLESVFDPALEERRKEAFRTKDYKNLPKKPLDVLLATNMISVGVDVKRLGLMVVAGQPKATAEYIQATSRVGRTYPGLVVTVFNWARPRDLSHYETFEHYHSTFYKHVEPLSVTPFSPGALQRGLAGLLVSMVRLRGTEFNPNETASRITTGNPYVQDAIDAIARRAELIGDGTKTGDFCRAELLGKADLWQAEAQNTTGGRVLVSVILGGGCGARDFVRRHDDGLDPRRTALGDLGVDADAMADGELDVVPVEHRREALFKVVVRADRAPLAEDRPVAGAGDDELRLEDVGLILGAPLLLSVDEKERDGEVTVPPADLALDGDVGEVGVGGRRPDRAILQRDLDDAPPGIPLPDP
jgi:hypothetical protein